MRMAMLLQITATRNNIAAGDASKNLFG